ncbi:hypothetical protein AKO1_012994, partial [Acrasis kona]
MKNVQVTLRESQGRSIKNLDCTKGTDSSCIVESDENGNFNFEDIPSGTYAITASHQGFRIEPSTQPITVGSSNAILKVPFKVLGFTLKGIVKDGSGQPLANVQVTATQKDSSGKLLTSFKETTDANGQYALLDVTTNSLIEADAHVDQYGFKPIHVQATPSRLELPPLVVSQYQVCGQLSPDQSQKPIINNRRVTFSDAEQPNQPIVETQTDSNGHFCALLEGPLQDKQVHQYDVRVEIGSDGSRFAPKRFELSKNTINNLTLTQSTVELTGRVQCIDNKCDDLRVELVSNKNVIETTNVDPKDGSFSFKKKLTLGVFLVRAIDSKDEYCWNKKEQMIDVDRSSTVDLIQSGYKVTITSTHDHISLMGRFPINLHKGDNEICIASESTSWIASSDLYVTDSPTYEWNANQSSRSVNVMVKSIIVTGSIVVKGHSAVDPSAIQVIVRQVNNNQRTIPVKSNGRLDSTFEYKIEMDANRDGELVIQPASNRILFAPRTQSLDSKSIMDTNTIPPFVGTLGIYVKGSTNGVNGVNVHLRDDQGQLITSTISNQDGNYEAGPISPDVAYTIHAEKPGFDFTRVMGSNRFESVQLSSLIVNVVDRKSQQFIPDVFVSISGSNQYRNNTYTAPGQPNRYYNLQPGTYHVRAVLKEYTFSPPSQSVIVKKGDDSIVNIVATRVAYSASGTLTSINGSPIKQVAVVATGIDDNSYEEGLSDDRGAYRLRGLKSGNKYLIRVKTGEDLVDRSQPEEMELTMSDVDRPNVDFVVLKKSCVTISGRVEIANDDLLHACAVELYKGSSPSSARLTQQQVLLSRTFVFVPKISESNYYIKLNCNLTGTEYKMDRQDLIFVANAKSSSSKKSTSATVGGVVQEGHGSYFVTMNPNIKKNTNDQTQEISQTPFFGLVFVVIVLFGFIYNERVSAVLSSLIPQEEKKKR